MSKDGVRQLRNLTVSIDPDANHAFAAMMKHTKKAIAEGYQGEGQGFSSMKQLFGVFTPKRWELLEKLQAIGPSSLRGLARALGRDVKRVHEDAAVLLNEGVIERDAVGRLVVPFETIHIDITLKAPPRAA